MRLRAQGSDGGHNGLKNINALLGTSAYARLRFGIGNDFLKGQQIDYVLGTWQGEEAEKLPALLERGGEIITSFVLQGIIRTMNTLPHSSAARERVLNIRTAQSHLSILTFSSTISLIKPFPFNFLLSVCIKSIHCPYNTL